MAAIKPSIKEILCFEKIPVALEKSYKMEAFVMGQHMYKGTWMPFVGENLDTAMQLNNVKKNILAQFFKKERRK